jgi:hypothetical protein
MSAAALGINFDELVLLILNGRSDAQDLAGGAEKS